MDTSYPPKLLYHFLPKQTGNRKYNKKLMSLDKDGERSLNNYHDRQKSLD